MKHQKSREEVTRIAREMSLSGLSPMTSGNVSARTSENEILITPSGLSYEDLEPQDIVIVSLDGETLEGTLEPSTESPMHTGLYRANRDIGGVVHTHSAYATTLACLGLEIPPVHYMLAALSEEGRVPLAPYATYGTVELAHNAGEALGSSSTVCLLQSHGTIAVASNVAQAYSRAEMLEEISKIYYRTLAVGEPIILSPDQIADTRDKIVHYGQSK